jgi:hypothetical protein
MGREANIAKQRKCLWCDQEHFMTANEILAHHERKLQEYLDEKAAKVLGEKDGETGSD